MLQFMSDKCMTYIWGGGAPDTYRHTGFLPFSKKKKKFNQPWDFK